MPPPRVRGASLRPAEDAAQVSLVVEPTADGDLGQAQVGLSHERLGAFDAPLQDPAMGRDTQGRLEGIVEVARRQAGRAGQIRDGEIADEARLDEVADALHLPGCQSAAAFPVR